ncbi:FecR family protein [Chitinophaga sp. GCM10012297]|uniref:FecR family protein n=1 Tax=Chitinophaga chungangae TaxID=2821488 RepID=A0ABS3YBU5_9BACT|nr:FecR domain-containing protein [Chitinophaga chungangae]MBO9152126.1 FecR family protein [Chitinophaga chungangae]
MKDSNRVWLLMGRQLSHSISVEEEKELKALLMEDPELWYAYELIQAVNNLDNVTNEFIDEIKLLLDGHTEPGKLSAILSSKLENARQEELPAPQPARIRRLAPLARAAAVAAGIAVTIWAGFYFFKPSQPAVAQGMNEIAAPRGSKTQITLADGTEIWLNAGSKLTYPKNFSHENREVTLVGEAFFKVRHDDLHPFIVHTQEADITDLGTSFNVKAYAGGHTTETTLIEGALEVSLKKDPSKKIRMKPNEKLVLRNTVPEAGKSAVEAEQELKVTDIVPYRQTNDIVETAWVDNKFIFRDERFEDLAAMMEKRYNVSIRISSDEIKAYQLTGIFKNESVEEALKVLQVIAPFKYSIQHDTITIHE